MSQQTPVTWEYQQKINKFGRFHTRVKEIEGEIDVLNKEIEIINDCISEVDNLLDPENAVKVKVGEIFIEVDNDEGLELIKAVLLKKEKAVKDLNDEKNTLDVELTSLKKELYSKFGDSISLE